MPPKNEKKKNVENEKLMSSTMYFRVCLFVSLLLWLFFLACLFACFLLFLSLESEYSLRLFKLGSVQQKKKVHMNRKSKTHICLVLLNPLPRPLSLSPHTKKKKSFHIEKGRFKKKGRVNHVNIKKGREKKKESTTR